MHLAMRTRDFVIYAFNTLCFNNPRLSLLGELSLDSDRPSSPAPPLEQHRDHDVDTQAALEVQFPPWFTSTHGLSRPPTPRQKDLERWCWFISCSFLCPLLISWIIRSYMWQMSEDILKSHQQVLRHYREIFHGRRSSRSSWCWLDTRHSSLCGQRLIDQSE